MQYLKKEVIDNVSFLHECKHQSCYQVDAIIFGGHDPKVTKITSSQYLFSLCPEKKRDKVDCLDTDKHQSFLEVNAITFYASDQSLPKSLN